MARRGRSLHQHMAQQDGISVFRSAVRLGGKRDCFRCGTPVMVRLKKGRWHVATHECWHGKRCRRQPKGASHLTPHYTTPACLKCRENQRSRISFPVTRSSGRWGWKIANLRLLPVPIPARGALGLWTVPDDVALAVQGTAVLPDWVEQAGNAIDLMGQLQASLNGSVTKRSGQRV